MGLLLDGGGVCGGSLKLCRRGKKSDWGVSVLESSQLEELVSNTARRAQEVVSAGTGVSGLRDSGM